MQRARTDSPPREVDSELEKGNFIAKDDYEYHPAKDDYEYAKGKSPLMRETAGRYGLSAVGAMAVLLFFSLRQVPAAHIGLVVMFGSVRESVLLSGLHVVNPVASVIQFNTKTQLLYSENIVPTQEGMNVELDVSLLYHADPSMIRDLYLSIGEEYKNVLILPELQSAVRGLTSEVSAKALYTSGRTEIRQKLVAELTTKLAPRGVILEDVLLKGIKLPVILTDAIEAKAKAEQESQRMEFVLSKEKQVRLCIVSPDLLRNKF